MRRSMLALTLIIPIGLVLAACASPSGSPGQSAGNEPSVPGAQSEAPAASQGESGGEGEGGAPALADGPWTGGQGQITVSGAWDFHSEAPLTAGTSNTQDAATLLAYNSQGEPSPVTGVSTATFITIFINQGPLAFKAYLDLNDATSARSENCEVTYNRADDTGIDGTFHCVDGELDYYGPDEVGDGPVTLDGSFTATR